MLLTNNVHKISMQMLAFFINSISSYKLLFSNIFLFFFYLYLCLQDVLNFIGKLWNVLFYFFPALICIAQFESCSGGSSSSAESTAGSQRAVSPSSSPGRSLTARELLFGVNHDEPVSRHYAVASPGSSDVSPQLSPVFKSEAARAIVIEMSSMRDSAGHNVENQPRRRAVPKEKRRHHTVSSSQPLLGIETTASPIMVLYKACHFLLMGQFLTLPLCL
jgi:hypothetical protein